MFSGASKILESPILRKEIIKISRLTVDLCNISHSTSLYFKRATSGNHLEKFVNQDFLSHKTRPSMKLPAIYSNELLHSHSKLNNHTCSKSGHTYNIRRNFCSISSKATLETGKTSHYPISNINIVKGEKSLLISRNEDRVLHNLRRTFLRPSLDSRQLGSISLLDIKKFLRQKLVDFKESHACLCLSVPKHALMFDKDMGENKPDTRWKNVEAELTSIYINKTTGGYVCPELALAGEWKQLQSFLVSWAKNRTKKRGEPAEDLNVLKSIDFESNEVVEKIWKLAKPVESLDSTEFKAILKHFKLPIRDGPNPEDFALHEVRVLDGNEHRLGVPSNNDADTIKQNASNTYQLLFPVRYPGREEIIGLKKIHLCKETKTILEENIPSSGFDPSKRSGEDELSRILPFPYGLDAAAKIKASSVVVVASVLDALLLRTPKNRSTAVIALAEDSTLPPEHLPFFELFTNITFWFPDSSSSAEDVTVFSRKLGEKRCSVMPRDYPQPTQYIRRPVSDRPGGTDMVQALKQNSRPCGHEYITTFDTLREDVFLEFAQFEETEGIKWKRFDKLNELIRGFRRGELTVFTGRTGSGKTTFISEYSLDLCMQGVNTLWGSFEVRNVRLAKMQLKQFSGINIEENLGQFDKWADKFTKLPMYYLTFHGAEQVDKVLDAMGYAVYVYDIAHVIIDNLQFMMGTDGLKTLDRYYAQDLIIGKFRKFASLHNVHLTLVIHPRKEDDDKLTVNSIFGGAKATQEADNVLLLQEEEVNEKVKRKYVQVAKNRFTGDLGVVPLFFNRSTTSFSKKIIDKEKQAAKQKKQSLTQEMSVGDDIKDANAKESTESLNSNS